ncbi:MAG: galactose oxidase, partial [Actinomycetota bacterium]|nr:galactose oxidase [Actinomycetota bacterium]
DFLPSGLATRAGHGAWAIQPDSRGTLWVGGDFTHSRNGTGATQWNGGFFRLGAGDSQAPTTPGNLATRRTNAGQLELTWTASTDDSGRALTYEVIAGDRVIAVKGGVSAVVDMPTATTNYFVRAVDRSGNRSATTAAQTAP